ncbi:diguanylate cyclase (GGDEF)-like protein/PAS domain S-box-containing protein [Vogesella perlucida]|nr:diguanylate cyclase (GGDEF)-like protein/PAS domain S-box-containing protein [Vogesella perlucida]
MYRPARLCASLLLTAPCYAAGQTEPVLASGVLSGGLAVLAAALAWRAWQRQRHHQRLLQQHRRMQVQQETLLQSLGEGVWGTDNAGHCIFVNDAALAMLGYQRHELDHSDAHALVHHHHPDGRPYPEYDCPIVQTRRDGQPRAGEDYLICKDGSFLPVWLTATPLREEGRQVGVVTTFRSIRTQKAAGEQIRRLNQAYAALSFTNQTIVREQDPQRLFERICEIAVLHGGQRMAWIGQHDTAQQYLRPLAVYGSGADYLDEITVWTRPDKTESHGAASRAVLEQQPVVIPSFRALARQILAGQPQLVEQWVQRIERYGWGATAAFPIRHAGEHQLVLAVYYGADFEFDEQLVNLFSEMASDIGYALDRIAMQQEQVYSRRLESTRAYLLECMNSDPPLPTGLQRIADYLQPLLRRRIAFRLPDGAPPPFDGLCLPVRGLDGHLLAELHAEGRSDDSLDPHDEHLLHSVLHLVALAIERKQAVSRLQLAATVFSHSSEGIMLTTPQGLIVDVNPAFSRITGYPREAVLGQNPRLLSSGRQDDGFYQQMWQTLREHGVWQGEIWNRRRDGQTYPELLTISAVYDQAGAVSHYLGVFSDISVLKQQEARLQRLAYHDALTELPNRVLLADRMQQAMAQARRSERLLGVCYLDLDGFKPVNDQYGHQMGDRVLVALAARLRQLVHGGDTVARLGGDEFVVLFTELHSPEQCARALQALLHEIALPLALDGMTLQLTASIGATLYPYDEGDADTLLRHADQAMYQAKQRGRNCYQLFDSEQARQQRDLSEQQARVRDALDSGELCLYYQPKVDMQDGRVVGAEALLRWQHPQLGLLSPAAFLPLIADSPLIVAVGQWVIDTALAQLDLWRRQGLVLTVSVNVAASQLQQPDFAAQLAQSLARYPALPPAQLALEILESAALRDIGQVSAVMQACAALGVSFALDDFGTGYSSLTYCKRLPASLLKIDQSFVRDMLDNSEDRALVEGVISLARAFGREVIAEGVETIAHAHALRAMGCRLGQGYGMARPMPAAALPGWVQAWPASAECQALLQG